MIIDKVVVAVIKALAKQFKLDKLEQVYKYVFDKNNLDEANIGIFKSIKEFKDKIKQIFSIMQGYEKRIHALEDTISSLGKSKEKKWYDK